MMANYRTLMQDLVDELENHPQILVKEAYIASGLQKDEIRDLEAEFGLKLDAAIRNMYLQMNGVTIEWTYDPDAAQHPITYRTKDPDEIGGKVDIFSLDEMLPQWEELSESVWDYMMSSEEEKEDLKDFRPFDSNMEEAFVGFMVKEGIVEAEMYYLKQEHDIIPVEASLGAYLNALRQARGYYWWQDAYALRPAAVGYDDMFYYLPQLFPGEDFSLFK